MCAGAGVYRDRNFRRNVPVMLTDRFLRADLLVHPALKELMRTLIARYAARCQVDIVGVGLLSNHYHLVVRQRFDGLCPRGVLGISAMARNLKSAFSNAVRRLVGIRGPKYESRFKSHNLISGEELLASLAYVHGQRAHHRLADGVVATSRGVFDGARDIVTMLPDFRELRGATFEERLASLGRLLDQITLRYVERRRESPERDMAEHRLHARAHRLSATLELAGAIAGTDAEAIVFRSVSHLRTSAPVRMPRLAALHVRRADGRVVRTKLVGEGASCWIEWALRMSLA